MSTSETTKRKAVSGETPSPLDCKKKITMDESVDETLSDTGFMFSQESLQPIATMGKSDRELLELICNRLNNVSLELQQVNTKQDRILKRIKQIEKKVETHDRDIDDIQRKQFEVQSQVTKLYSVQNVAFNLDVTIVAVNMPRNAQDDDLRLATRLLEAVGCRNKKWIQVMRIPAREGRSGIFKVEFASKEDKIEILRRKATLKQSDEFKNVYLRSSMSHTERLSQLSFKTLLSAGKDLRLTGNGRIIRKLDGGQNTVNNKGQRRPIQKGSPVVSMTVNRAPVTSAVLNGQVSPITSYSDMVHNAADITPRNPPVQPPTVIAPGICQPRPLFHSQVIRPSGHATGFTHQGEISSGSPIIHPPAIQQLPKQPPMNNTLSNSQSQFIWSQHNQGDFTYLQS